MVARLLRSVGRGWKAHSESWDWLGGPGVVGYPSRVPGWVESHYQLATSGCEALAESRDGSGDTPGWMGGVRRPIQIVGRSRESLLVIELGQVRRTSRRAGWGWEALPESQEGSRGPTEVGRYSWWARRDQKALPDSQEWSGTPPGGQGVVGSPFQWAGGGRKSLPDGQECSEGPPGGSGGSSGEPRGVGRPFWRAGRGREGQNRLGVGRVGVMRPSRMGWEELGDPPGEPRRVRRPSRRGGRGREGQERLAVPPKGPEGFERPFR